MRFFTAVTAVLLFFGISEVFAQAKPLQKVRVSKGPIANYVPVDFALGRGWFKEDLDVNIEGGSPARS